MRECSAHGCQKASKDGRYCSMHAARMKRGGTLERRVPLPPQTPQERVMYSVEKVPSGCWEWKASLNASGYGQLNFGRKMQPAHRFAWKAFVGDPGDLCVLHTCDNRKCCNPDHLFLGTRTENMQDKVRKNRQAKGAATGRARLDEQKVRQIRVLAENGHSQRLLAAMYSITHSVITRVVQRRAWAHVS